MDDWGDERHFDVGQGDVEYKKTKVRVGVALGVVITLIVIMLVSFIVYEVRTISLEEYQQQNMSQDYKKKESKDVADNSRSGNMVNEIENTLENNKNSVERFGTVVDGDSFAMLGKLAVLNYKVLEKDYNIGLLYDNELIYVGYVDKLPKEVLERYGVKESDSNYEVRDFKGKHYFVKKGVEFVDV